MRKKKQKIQIKRLEKPLLPYVIALLAIGFLSVMIFSVNPNPQKTGFAASIEEKEVQCLKQGRDNSNMAVYSQDSCCFLIENSDRCRPAVDEQAYFRGRTGNYDGYLDYDYACFGGTTERVFFTDEVRYYCGLEI